MDGADATGVLLLGLVLAAGLASFALAAMVGGGLTALAVRRGPAGLGGWALVATAGVVIGPVVLVGLSALWSSLEPALGELPLLYPTWAAAALAGAATRVAVATLPDPAGWTGSGE